MAENEDLKKFTLSFFSSLKSEYSWNGNTLIITKVPASFEKFYGKNLPYRLFFSPEEKLLEGNENAELVAQGSFILHCMKEFLNDRGKTTLVKIDFDLNDSDILKRIVKPRNSEIASISKNPMYDSILRFTFLTTLKYLNEKNEIINSFYFKDKNPIDFNLDNYKTSEGKKEDISVGEIKSEYEAAKNQLKTLIKPKIESISEILSKKLEKEIERIKHHYYNQLKEDSENIIKMEKQINDFQNSLNNPSEKDFAEIKIKKARETIDSLKSPKRKEELKKEEDFFIKDEINKHSINLDTKMINTTIAYYPVLKYSFYLKNKDSARLLEIIHNPLLGKNSSFKCEVCSKDLGEIWLCSSGHIICYSCSRACLECGREYCKNCLKTSCFSCNKNLCRKCAKKCSSCQKYKCKNHMHNSSTCLTCAEKNKLKRPSFSYP